jgi:hypothetical protein
LHGAEYHERGLDDYADPNLDFETVGLWGADWAQIVVVASYKGAVGFGK